MTQACVGPDPASAVARGVCVAPGSPTVGVGDESRCPGCRAHFADDQRFCLACGLRLAPDELRLAALPLLTASISPVAAPLAASAGGPTSRRPVVRSAAITAVVVLALGIAIGATIGPATVGETVAAQRPVILVSAPATAAPAPATSDEDSSAGDEGEGGAADEVQTLADAGAGEETTTPAAEAPPETPASDTPPADETDGEDEQPAVPATPPPGSLALAGVVAATAADGEGFVLAARDGRLLHVHASGCGVAPGDDLHLRARQLANGTWSADRVRRVASADDMRVAGTVVWSDPASGRYALGARGVTLFVTVPAPPAAPVSPVDPAAPQPPAAPVPPVDPAPAAPQQPAPQAPPPPAVPVLGAQLRVRLQPVAAHDGQPAALVEQVRRDAPPPADPAALAPPLELAGLVQSVDPQAHTLVLALDPDTQPPLTLTLSVPPAIDLAQLLPAQRIAVTAVARPDGSLALSGVSPDGDALTADDATAFQGDQSPATPPSRDATPTTTVATCTALDAPVATRSSARSPAAG